MTEKIGVGLIGCGGIARMKHLPALRANADKARLVAVSDVNLARRAGAGGRIWR